MRNHLSDGSDAGPTSESSPSYGSPGAGFDPQQLATQVYRELKKIANRHVGRQAPNASLQATDLVHEAYLRLALPQKEWHESRSFLAAAAKAMRSVLVDHARARQRLKRQPPGERVALDELCRSFEENAVDLLALDEALDELAKMDAPMARAVELRFFVGLSARQTAEHLELPLRSFERQWSTVKSWLYRRVR